ncbi:GIY-YIG nuclease family protein [Pseudothauera nasutitermitis]|nr:GIY-YIG nuclease family protein [Pseudothauera nasutitermitis]
MQPTTQPPSPLPTVFGSGLFLYFLDDQESGLVKIGHTEHPWRRIATVAGRHLSIDLAESMLIEVDTRQLEFIVHSVFSDARRPRREGGEGSTEWFERSILPEAIELCHYVGQLRGRQYVVQRDLRGLVSTASRIRARELERRSRPLSRAVRQQCSPERAAQQFLAILAERTIDLVVTNGESTVLCRRVDDDEPHRRGRRLDDPTRWAVRLYAAAEVVRPGSKHNFQAITSLPVQRQGDHYIEYISLVDRWQNIVARQDDSPECRFLTPVAEALAKFPTRRLPKGRDVFDAYPERVRGRM